MNDPHPLDPEPASSPATEDETLSELVARALEIRDDEGSDASIDWLCRHRPDLKDRVLEAVDLAGRFVGLQQRATRALAPDAAPLLSGRYRVGERLGVGAMGAVWEAVDAQLDRRVAIKVLGGAIPTETASVDRFEREAHALAAVYHPSVVTVHDNGITESGEPFLVMELVEGVTLSDLLDRRDEEADRRPDLDMVRAHLPPTVSLESNYVRQVVRWFTQLAAGIEAAHGAGVVHRDIKPSNIMIRPDGRAILLDFGIAFVRGSAELTRTGASLGTPAYMAPEALESGSEVRETQDVWGLAATLYHALSGRAPYGGSPSQVLSALAVREPDALAGHMPELPRDLEAILDHALVRNPARRYPTMAALRADLEAFLDHRAVSVEPIGPFRRAIRRVGRSKTARGAFASVAVLAVIVSAFATHAWVERRAEARGNAAWAAVPANLTVSSPFLREIAEPEDQAALLRVLDKVVASGRHPVAGLAVRASLHADFGNQASAIEDMRAIARHVDSAYTRALADAYEGLGPKSPAVTDLDLGSLPVPVEPMDHYLFGYHELRQLRRDDAAAYLQHEGLRKHRHSRELAVLCATAEIDLFRKKSETTQRLAAAAKLLELARAVESDFGYQSAMTEALQATALVVLQRWHLALQHAEASVALGPLSVPALENGAFAARKLKRDDRVQAFARVAIRLVPENPRIHDHSIRSASSAGRASEALAHVRTAPFGKESDRAYLQALVECNEAVRQWTDSVNEETVEWAARALATATAADPENKSSRFRTLRELATALTENDVDQLFLAALDLHSMNPLSVPLLELLCRTFPERIPERSRDHLRGLLETVRDTIASGDLVASTGRLMAD